MSRDDADAFRVLSREVDYSSLRTFDHYVVWLKFNSRPEVEIDYVRFFHKSVIWHLPVAIGLAFTIMLTVTIVSMNTTVLFYPALVLTVFSFLLFLANVWLHFGCPEPSDRNGQYRLAIAYEILFGMLLFGLNAGWNASYYYATLDSSGAMRFIGAADAYVLQNISQASVPQLLVLFLLWPLFLTRPRFAYTMPGLLLSSTVVFGVTRVTLPDEAADSTSEFAGKLTPHPPPEEPAREKKVLVLSCSALRRPLRLFFGPPVPRAGATRKAQRWVRPHLVENTISRPICEVKQPQAQSVLRSEMTREP